MGDSMTLTYTQKINLYILFIAITILGLPLFPAVFAYEGRTLKWNNHFAIDSIGLAGLIVGTATLLLLRWRRSAQWKELLRELAFIFWQGKFACAIGISLGLVTGCLYLLLPFDKANDDFAERAASSFAIYLGTIGSVLGIHTLYRKSAPITEVETLLESLCDDLEEHGRLGNKLLFIYPALNIGYYRALRQYGFQGESDHIPDQHPYRRFTNLLVNTASRLKSGARIITYPEELYGPLYEIYDRDKNGSDSSRVTMCAEEAKRLDTHFVTAAGVKGHISLAPYQCPPQVFVIGPVSYSVLSYGLPRYNAQTKKFEPVYHNYVNILVYRREDPALSSMILAEVERELVRNGYMTAEMKSTTGGS